MSTLAMLLHEPAASVVRGWWDRLEAEVGLRGVRRVPFPHVTLFGFDGVPHPAVQDLLDDLCYRLPPLRLKAVGVGLFLQPTSVIYAPVIRSPELSSLHRELWDALGRLGADCFKLYAPAQWIPHVTLAQSDLTPERSLQAMHLLSDLDLHLEFEVRNLTIFDWIGPLYEPRERYPLRGQAVGA